MKRKINTAWRIYNSFSGLKGKAYAISVIISHALKIISRRLGIKLPGKLSYLSEPVGVANLASVEERLRPLNIAVRDGEPARVNVLLPALVPQIIFGGYIAVLNFILRLVDHGYQVRIIVCEETDANADRIRENCKDSKIADKVLGKCELLVVHDRNDEITVSKQDVYVGYSWLTMRLASAAAAATNNKLPLFFIQEFEAIFHPYDSFRALCIETYGLPHFPIFNSELLKQFFERKSLGVFDPLNPVFGNDDKYAFFSHAISNITPPDLTKLEGRARKKLLFYARPEPHAARNIFEIGMLALKQAIKDGVFSSDWEFYGIGSLALSQELELPEGITLKMLPRVSLEEYCNMMSDYDVGLALMYAPHPSVPPFEMAAAGMLTVTSTFESRTTEDMESITSNLIATEPAPRAVADGLKSAVERVSDFKGRLDGAKFEWPRSWSEAFNDKLLDELSGVLPYKGHE